MDQIDLSKRHVATVNLDMVTAMCIIAQIQLATRHRGNIGPSRDIAEAFARTLQQRVIEVAPENAAVLEMGWNPNYDTYDS